MLTFIGGWIKKHWRSELVPLLAYVAFRALWKRYEAKPGPIPTSALR